MGSELWRRHMNSAVRYLVAFGKQPKQIEGRNITDWFRLGEDIFVELYGLGGAVQWNYSLVRQQASELIPHLTKNKDGLQTFINIYPTLRIDLEIGSARDVCMVRSGIEVLLRGFVGVDTSFDSVLKDLDEFGELDELDRCLKIWWNSGYQSEIDAAATSSSAPATPESHWWWH